MPLAAPLAMTCLIVPSAIVAAQLQYPFYDLAVKRAHSERPPENSIVLSLLDGVALPPPLANWFVRIRSVRFSTPCFFLHTAAEVTRSRDGLPPLSALPPHWQSPRFLSPRLSRLLFYLRPKCNVVKMPPPPPPCRQNDRQIRFGPAASLPVPAMMRRKKRAHL